MRIIDDLTFTREDFSSPVVTIGNYDGLHLGHQAIIKRVIELARDGKKEAVVLTFEPHPVKFLHPELQIPLITPYRKKMMLLEQFGVDVTINLAFTEDIARMSAKEFIQEIVQRRIAPCWVVVGFNFTFGKGRTGTPQELNKIGEELGFGVEIIPPHTVAGEVVSSTRIRELIARGDIREANRMLGSNFFMLGKVIHGHARGKGLGFPTANLEITQDLYPKEGVYAATVIVDEQTYDGVVNIGTNPTFGDEKLAVEVFLFDYHGDLYGKELQVALVDKLRDEQTFPSVDALVRQIGQDIQKAKEILRGK
ncbi:MAG: riboflavin biosynthesis protein RibF [Deltaproteobacteria bacterium RBG_16_54_11]|nr:MAG: riboflavin biosynthesis protein RibF [Deltaproteobacteria bacterium RBG_16_54_11]